ncbi:MAG: hypothetical protein R3330_09300 [Saprospiraceae bacterium]|nr:hypothetical protein [Saprospiraceae bacterium]
MTITPTDLNRGNNWCDACVILIGEFTIRADAGDGYTARTMRLCRDHLRMLSDRIWTALLETQETKS